MAQTKKRRRRKHRGTQGGSIDRRRRGRPRSREEARAQARRQAGQRRERPPTWRSAVNRALVMAAILFVLMAVITKQPAGSSLLLSLTMLLVYIPAGYYLERFLYNRRQAAAQRARTKKAQGKG